MRLARRSGLAVYFGLTLGVGGLAGCNADGQANLGNNPPVTPLPAPTTPPTTSPTSPMTPPGTVPPAPNGNTGIVPPGAVTPPGTVSPPGTNTGIVPPSNVIVPPQRDIDRAKSLILKLQKGEKQIKDLTSEERLLIARVIEATKPRRKRD